MSNGHRTKGRFAAAARSALSLALAMVLLVTALPTAWAQSVGSNASSLTRSNVKVYIKLSKQTTFFTGETYGTGSVVSVPANTVWQLVSENYYTVSGVEYYGVYYNSKRFNVRRSDVQGDILSAADLETYITGTMWKLTSYPTLRQRDNLVGDIRVQAVQLALYRLGYYSGALDGDYGSQTSAAVRSFQRANNLSRDGSAGPLTQPVLFALASGSTTPSTGTGGATTPSGSTTVPASGTLRTTDSVNLRKNATTSSARLDVVPRNTTLSYTDTYVRSGVTWFYVTYNGRRGWLMGTYVSASGNASSPSIGTVTITKPSTRVRLTPNGKKSGTVLATGTVVDLLAQPVSAGGYTWYNIRTASGLIGYVRGDCSTASIGSSGSTVTPSTAKTFVRLPAATLLFTTNTKPASGGVTVPAGTVLQMVSTVTYTSGGVEYCSLYYNNTRYNAVYADVKSGILSAADTTSYIVSLWDGFLPYSLKRESDQVGDVYVYSMQFALSLLGYYTGSLDGTFGGGSQSAVRNFQRKAKITVDGDCGSETWSALTVAAKAAYTGSGTGGGGSTGGGTTTGFGTVNVVTKGYWDDDGLSLFPKATYATVMDKRTQKVFRVYRWSGSSHADCVPATAADTQVMCEIVGFPYNASHPNSSQLALIKADGDKSDNQYTWPDFNNKLGTVGDSNKVGNAWDRRPAYLNVNGTVYCVSIYGHPHGFTGTDAFSQSRFNDSSRLFFEVNNYYGMMCIHFTNSSGHGSGTVDAQHQAAIEEAYSYASTLWPGKVK